MRRLHEFDGDCECACSVRKEEKEQRENEAVDPLRCGVVCSITHLYLTIFCVTEVHSATKCHSTRDTMRQNEVSVLISYVCRIEMTALERVSLID